MQRSRARKRQPSRGAPQLAAKTVLVTGAARGLGRELARQYAASGWQVIACGRSRSADSFEAGIDYQPLDVADPDLREKDGARVRHKNSQSHRDREDHSDQRTDKAACNVHETLQQNITASDVAKGGRNGQVAADPLHVFMP